LGRRHSRKRDAAAIRHHYDVGNDFYQLWLDAQAVYSCAYFAPGVQDIDAAQDAKLDYICRKLRLHPGERFLDIGCGWGALIRHAARRYHVEAVGITLSPSQAELARRRIAEDGLADCCRVEVRDYRDLPDRPLYDKVASVGMVEHVGRARLPRYFETVLRVLRPGGQLLNHGIIDLEEARSVSIRVRARRWLWREGQFFHRYVFPDGELPSLAEVVSAAEQVGFESRDLESLREHYVLTLRQWLKRLEAREHEAVALVGETTYRVWRLYLAASAHAFAAGRIGVVQLLLAKPRLGTGSEVPLTRDDLYAPAAATVAEALAPYGR
jgi:cyclopropane-fatty-acyl-phospholipid synthase